MTDLTHAAFQVIAEHRSWGAALVGLIAFGESMVLIGAFLPATVLLLAAGGLIAAGALDAAPVMIWATLGAVAGDAVSFLIGQRLGARLLRRQGLKRHARNIARTRLLIRRFGGATLLLGRFAGPLRAFVPVMAGMLHMPDRRFHLANLASGLVWVVAFVGPGYVTARGLDHLSGQTIWMLAGALALVLALAAIAVLARRTVKPALAWLAGQRVPAMGHPSLIPAACR